MAQLFPTGAERHEISLQFLQVLGVDDWHLRSDGKGSKRLGKAGSSLAFFRGRYGYLWIPIPKKSYPMQAGWNIAFAIKQVCSFIQTEGCPTGRIRKDF